MSGYAGSDAEPVARTRNRPDLFPAAVSKEPPPPAHAASLGDLAPLEDLVVDPVLPEEMRKEESSRPAPCDDHVPHASPFPPTGLSYHRLPEIPRLPG